MDSTHPNGKFPLLSSVSDIILYANIEMSDTPKYIASTDNNPGWYTISKGMYYIIENQRETIQTLLKYMFLIFWTKKNYNNKLNGNGYVIFKQKNVLKIFGNIESKILLSTSSLMSFIFSSKVSYPSYMF